MFQINHRCLAAVLGALIIVTGMARAQTGSSGKPAWEVEVRKELPEHDPPFYRAYITAGTNKFALLLPAGYFLQEQQNGVIKLASAGGSQITFAVRSPIDSRYTDNDSVRVFLLAAHPGAKITSEFGAAAGRWTGHGFDLEWKSSSGNTQNGRTVVVPFEGGVLEFTATTSPENFPVIQALLDRFERSLIVGRDGKLEVPHLSGKY